MSPDGHIFDDLGADSLVVAASCAHRRNEPELPAVSIKEVYQHPSIADLARHLKEVGGEHDSAPVEASRIAVVESAGEDRRVSTLGYWLCGLLQLATLLGVLAGVALVVRIAYDYVAPASGFRDTYVRSVAVGVLLFAADTVVPLAVKALVIGRWKPTRIRLWSLGYFRFWLVRLAILASPMRLFAGSPIYPL